MAIIPLKQRIKIIRKGVEDEWGNSMGDVTLEYKARVDETVTVVPNQVGDEAVSGFSILLDKLADVTYDDTIEYTNELGVTVRRKPIKIEPIRMPSTKATMTGVYC